MAFWPHLVLFARRSVPKCMKIHIFAHLNSSKYINLHAKSRKKICSHRLCLVTAHGRTPGPPQLYTLTDNDPRSKAFLDKRRALPKLPDQPLRSSRVRSGIWGRRHKLPVLSLRMDSLESFRHARSWNFGMKTLIIAPTLSFSCN